MLAAVFFCETTDDFAADYKVVLKAIRRIAGPVVRRESGAAVNVIQTPFVQPNRWP